MRDLISRQAVLNLLHALPPEDATTKALLIQSVKQMDAPDNLVKDSQGLAKELVNDTISRKAAIDATWFEPSYTDPLNVLTEVRDRLKALPSAQPGRKRGKWIDYTDEGYVECPFCHSATNCDGNKDELHFCFSCGADMRGEQE